MLNGLIVQLSIDYAANWWTFSMDKEDMLKRYEKADCIASVWPKPKKICLFRFDEAVYPPPAPDQGFALIPHVGQSHTPPHLIHRRAQTT